MKFHLKLRKYLCLRVRVVNEQRIVTATTENVVVRQGQAQHRVLVFSLHFSTCHSLTIFSTE